MHVDGAEATHDVALVHTKATVTRHDAHDGVTGAAGGAGDAAAAL